MATTEQYVIGTLATLMSSELDSLNSSSAFTAGAVSNSAYNNVQGGGGGNGYTRGEVELTLAAPAGALSAGASAYLWFLAAVNGTNYEDGSASVIPARAADVIIPVRAVNTTQRVIIKNVTAPPGSFKTLVSQNTGQTWGNGNTIKWLPYTRQGV